MNESERKITKAQYGILERLAQGEEVFGGFLERARMRQLYNMGIVRKLANKRVLDTISVEKWELTDDGIRLIMKLGLAEAKDG